MSELTDKITQWGGEENIRISNRLDRPEEFKCSLQLQGQTPLTVYAEWTPDSDRLRLIHHFDLDEDLNDTDWRQLSERFSARQPGLLSCRFIQSARGVKIEMTAEICIDGLNKHAFLTEIENIRKAERQIHWLMADRRQAEEQLKEMNSVLEESESAVDRAQSAINRVQQDLRTESPAEPESPESPVSPSPHMGGHTEPSFCSNCGSQLKPGTKFCVQCGFPID